MSRPRKPEQSMNRSPLTSLPSSSFTDSIQPSSPRSLTSTILRVGALHAALLRRSRADRRVQRGIELEGVAEGGHHRGRIFGRHRERFMRDATMGSE